MEAWGAIIMSFFGAVFFVAAVVPVTGWRTPLLLVPCGVFVAMAIAAIRQLKSAPGAAGEEDPHAGRVIAWSSAGEGIAIAVAAIWLANTGHSSLILPTIALIVGLHFLPIAYAIPFPRFYAVGACLIGAAILGVVLPASLGWIISGLSASAALWMASLFALRRSGRAAWAHR